MSTPDTRQPWVSVKQAAIHFGTSESDIRRRIKRGELQSESFERPGGTLLRVRLPASGDAPEAHQPAPDTRQGEPEALQDIAAGLLERLAAQDATIAEKDATIARINAEGASWRERAGRAETERDLLRAELERARARRWWQWW